jgi:hypothetical protein
VLSTVDSLIIIIIIDFDFWFSYIIGDYHWSTGSAAL